MDFSNIRRGSTVLLHSSFSRINREHRWRPDQFIDKLLERLGGEGTLLLPLFNFEFPKGVAFDIKTTPSQMGALTEAGRTWPSAVRTGHPIYSFAVIGAKAEMFSHVDNRSGYGSDSPFAMLRDLDGDIAVLDLPDQHSMTFYHHVEEMLEVDYRFHKEFTGAYTGWDGVPREKSYSIFVRDVDRGVVTSVDRMGELLWSKGLYRGDRPKQASGLRVVSAAALYDEVASVIRDGKAREYLYDVE
ncbi:aminoglycoside 3-N-acetyltransferase [Sinorhizobium fredii]